MRTVTCYVPGGLHPETMDALQSFAATRVEVDLVELPAGDEHAYRRMIAYYWRQGEDFMVVEPDILIREDVIDAFMDCDCEYGCFPYAWLTDVGPALGCTWFRSSFLEEYPEAVLETGLVSWRQLDVVLMRHVLARKYHEQPHVHLPAVQHLNPEKQLMEGRDPAPLMEVPHW